MQDGGKKGGFSGRKEAAVGDKGCQVGTGQWSRGEQRRRPTLLSRMRNGGVRQPVQQFYQSEKEWGEGGGNRHVGKRYEVNDQYGRDISQPA